MNSIWREYKWLIIVTLSYLLIAGLLFGVRGDFEFIAYLGITICIGLLIISTASKSGLDHLVLWLLSIWGFLHMLGGLLPVGDTVLYGWKIYPFMDHGGDFYILKMDQVIHFYGFMTAAVVMHQLISHRSVPWVHPGMLIFFASIGSLGLSAVNEIIEFLVFVNLEETGVGDIYNMGLDLIFNAAGALCGAIWQQTRMRPGG